MEQLACNCVDVAKAKHYTTYMHYVESKVSEWTDDVNVKNKLRFHHIVVLLALLLSVEG